MAFGVVAGKREEHTGRENDCSEKLASLPLRPSKREDNIDEDNNLLAGQVAMARDCGGGGSQRTKSGASEETR